MNNFKRTKPKVSIIVPSWFRVGMDGKYGEDEVFNIANECLKRLIKVTPKELYELIIIDNGSTLKIKFDAEWEKNLDKVDIYFKEANIVIRNKTNLGFAPAVNQGLNLARGEFVIVMNNDILVWENWLEIMIKDFEENEHLFNPNIGLLMPAIVKEKINFWDAIKLKKEEINMETNVGKFGDRAEFGSCYLGRKELFMEVAKNRDGYQVMDEKFLLGMGEDRWMYREIRMLGKETYRTHNLRVLHVGNVTISKIPNRKEYTFKNREYLEELKKKHNID